MISIEQILGENEKKILEKWLKNQIDTIDRHKDLISTKQIENDFADFLRKLVKAIASGQFEDFTASNTKEIIRHVKNLSLERAKLGFTPVETAQFIFGLKTSVLSFLRAYYRSNPEIIFNEMIKLNDFFDKLGLISFDEYVKGHDQMIKEQAETLKHTMQQLKRTFDELELLVKTIPEGIFVLSSKGITKLANNSFKDLYKNIVKEPLVINSDIKSIPTNNILIKTIQEIINEKKEKVYVIAPKEDLWLQLFSKFVHTSNQFEPDTVIIEVHDISKFIEVENLRKQFMSKISHELWTPITSIDLSIKNLEKYKNQLSNQQKEEMINMISWSSTVLTEMLGDLLILSRIESQTIILNLALANLRKLMTNVLNTLEPKRIEKNITIIVEVSDDITLICDEMRIRQILRILIDNSIKYSKDNSKVIIRAINNYKGSYNPKNMDCVLVEVIDFGIGIKNVDIPYIFQTFFRSKDVSTIEGSGIGLSIAKQLTLLHKGDIFVESEYEKGSKFIVLLPKELPKEEKFL